MAPFPAPSRRQFPASWPEAAVVTSPVHRAGARGRGCSGTRAECRPGREAGSLAGGEFPAADVGRRSLQAGGVGRGVLAVVARATAPSAPPCPPPLVLTIRPGEYAPGAAVAKGLGGGRGSGSLEWASGAQGTAGAGRSQREKAAGSREIPLLQMKYSGFREVTSTYSASECWREFNFTVGRNPIDHLVHLPHFTHEENEARKVWFCPVGSII
ncbi:uncharacterized protein LOC115894172 [Rhinopithecus roxellana]|uniref:uncharacterized protein LOC115894172 n=1 Tax=Rhinopithecus roxellana TaxID=61622 RepID=UPI00123778CB|nr:uncharacterized protein LOC115894172 [Rhinopithecus roxellana]